MPEIEEPDNGASGQQDEAAGGKDQKEHADATPRQTGNQTDTSKLSAPRPRMAADVTLNLTVDSSLDGEKLEKQLALLRRYGLI